MLFIAGRVPKYCSNSFQTSWLGASFLLLSLLFLFLLFIIIHNYLSLFILIHLYLLFVIVYKDFLLILFITTIIYYPSLFFIIIIVYHHYFLLVVYVYSLLFIVIHLESKFEGCTFQWKSPEMLLKRFPEIHDVSVGVRMYKSFWKVIINHYCLVLSIISNYHLLILSLFINTSYYLSLSFIYYCLSLFIKSLESCLEFIISIYYTYCLESCLSLESQLDLRNVSWKLAVFDDWVFDFNNEFVHKVLFWSAWKVISIHHYSSLLLFVTCRLLIHALLHCITFRRSVY